MLGVGSTAVEGEGKFEIGLDGSRWSDGTANS